MLMLAMGHLGRRKGIVILPEGGREAGREGPWGSEERHCNQTGNPGSHKPATSKVTQAKET